MKTNFIFKILAMVIAGTCSIYQVNAQTFGAGNLGGSGCTATGIAGNCTDTYVGNASGKNNNTGQHNSFYGDSSGYTNTSGAHNTFLGKFSGFKTTTGNYLTFVGSNAGKSNRIASDNVAIGYQALYSNDSLQNNTAVGYQALYSLSNCDCWQNLSTNTAVGYQALYNTQAYGGAALGYHAGYNNTTGCGITAIGENALLYNTTGDRNVGIGPSAGSSNVTGNDNTSVGDNAGGGISDNSNSYNCFFGSRSGMGITTGNENTFSGYKSGFSNTTASGNTFSGGHSGHNTTTGTYNVVTGDSAFYYSATGGSNTIAGFKAGFGASGYSFTGASLFGYNAGYSNRANNVTFIGAYSGYSNLTALYNTFVGYAAGYTNNLLGNTYNTFIGHGSGYSNTTGIYNSFLGHQSGYKNTTGGYNTFIGLNAGYENTTGKYNVAVGKSAGSGSVNVTGDSCVFIGAQSDKNGNYNNAAAIGFGASALASDKMYFGNSIVIGCYNQTGTWTSSDGRFKFNVKEEVKGLDFIKKLRPITYQMNTQQFDAFIKQNMPQQTDSLGNPVTVPASIYSKSKGIVHSGFIAQEVEQAATDCGFTSSIVSKPENSTEPYALRYEEFVVPLVKAVQELSKKADSLQSTIDSLTAKKSERKAEQNNDSLAQKVAQLEQLINQCCSVTPSNEGNNERQGSIINEHQLELTSSAILFQNSPNPFGDGTTIKYFVPDNANAQIIFYNEFGSTLKEFKVEEKGMGQLNISAMNLASGSYSYSLIINGKVIDTKKMIRGR